MMNAGNARRRTRKAVKSNREKANPPLKFREAVTHTIKDAIEKGEFRTMLSISAEQEPYIKEMKDYLLHKGYSISYVSAPNREMRISWDDK